MAITWGAARSDGSNAFRIGYEITQSPATVLANTTTVGKTLKLYLQTQYTAYQSSTADWSVSGNWSGSGGIAFNHNASGQWSDSNITALLVTTIYVATSTTGKVRSSFSASISNIVAVSGTASVSGYLDTAQRPISAPAAPGTAAAARVSDTQHNVTWTNTNPTSTTAPYAQVLVERYSQSSLTSGSWAIVATLNGYPTSWTDKGTVANRRYAYRVRAKNGAGTTAPGPQSPLYSTTPSPPAYAYASKGSTDISIIWSNTAFAQVGVEVWHAANGVWDGTRLALVGGSATSYTHVSPNTSQTHTYRLKAVSATPTLYSAYSVQTNVVQLLAQPSAPSLLAPAGAARDATGPIVMTWQHNPTDTTAQKSFTVQWREQGSPSWLGSGVIVSGISSFTLPANTFTNGRTIEWQVRTSGQFATASPWSAVATIALSAAPTATISTPGATFGGSRLTATWVYYDEEATPQAQWQADLLDAGGRVLDARSGSGEATSATFAYVLLDGRSYGVRVRVLDGAGLWGDYDEAAFSVAYATPEVPILTAVYNPENESVSVTVTNPATTGGHVDAVTNQVWRRIASESTWYLIAEGLPVNASIIDHIPSLTEANLYKAVAISALPSSIESETGERPQLVLNPGFEDDALGWTAVTGTVVSSSALDAHEGIAIGEYTATGAAGSNYIVSSSRPVDPGKVISASAWVRSDAGSPVVSMKVGMAFLTAADVVVGTTTYGSNVSTVGSGWVFAQLTGVTAPPTAAKVRMYVYSNNGSLAAGQGFDVDDVTLKENAGMPVSAISPGSLGPIVNAGPNFSLDGKLWANSEVSVTIGRERALRRYSGRKRPTAYSGEHGSLTIALSANISKLRDDMDVLAQLELIAEQDDPACYRDPSGRRVFVSLSDLGVSDLSKRIQRASWTLSESDYVEPTEALDVP